MSQQIRDAMSMDCTNRSQSKDLLNGCPAPCEVFVFPSIESFPDTAYQRLPDTGPACNMPTYIGIVGVAQVIQLEIHFGQAPLTNAL